jgi:hypothetical protein
VLLGLVLILVQRFAQNGLFPFIERLGRKRRAPTPKAAPVVANSMEDGHAG